ncbi:MAG: DUF5518 domain-containing protein [Haloarculaceae archaeon]
MNWTVDRYVDRDSLLYDAGVGAAVTLLLTLSPLPFTPLAGGAVASYRRRCGWLAGAGAGLLSGIVVSIPLLVLFVPIFAIVTWLGFGIQPESPAFELYVGLVFAIFFAYTVGLSLLGGIGGVYAHRYTDWNLDPGRFF